MELMVQIGVTEVPSLSLSIVGCKYKRTLKQLER